MISHTAADDPNVVGVPAADQVGPQDVSQEQDSSHTWQGEDGTLLQVGQTYEMHSPDYQIPDIVKIVAPENVPIGVGKAQIDSEKARTLIGKKGQRPIVHYDYLYLD